MSVTIEVSESRLTLGVIKLALALVGVIALIGVLFSVLLDRGQNLAVAVLLISVAFYFLVNGVLVVLKIIDWFEARQRSR